VPGDAAVEDGVIVEAGLVRSGGPSHIAAPGFVDLHVNGFAGVDFLAADAAGYERAGEAMLQTGVVAYRPAFVSAPQDALIAALRAVSTVASSGPAVLGAHLEGPFIARLGAHAEEHRRDPDAALLERLLDAGPVEQVTLAPELPGALELVDLLVARGITVAAGHSDATAAQARAGFARGMTAVVHIFNAMRRPARGELGIAFAALAHPGVAIQLIADRVHVPDDGIRTVFNEAGGRVALVTDATAAAAAPDGDYALGPLRVRAQGGEVRDAAGRLAGSALTMDAGVRNVVELGLSLEDALHAAAALPASIARRPVRGVVVLDDRLEVVRTIL
jgi:N-acetylglucosamine-6-phosphate deacetylase